MIKAKRIGVVDGKMIDNLENVKEYFLDKNIHDNYVLPNILER